MIFNVDCPGNSTIHGIKGGEFNTVFYLGVSDELYIKNKSFKKEKDKENELQVMNVAMTRARRRLYLLFPIDLKTWKKGKTVPNPWRFLRKVDEKLLNVISKK
jgi:ATP-dependent DNA helicase UvrD/PcrA